MLLTLLNNPYKTPTVGYGLLAFWTGGAGFVSNNTAIFLTPMGVFAPL